MRRFPASVVKYVFQEDIKSRGTLDNQPFHGLLTPARSAILCDTLETAQQKSGIL